MQNNFYVGKQIGNYRITNLLASGSFGTVFLAHHIYLKQRIVVVKFLHAIRLDSEEEKEQFLQEAQILEMLRGLPHILPLLDVGVESDSSIPYQITEYAERGSLRNRLKDYSPGQFPLDEALSILSQIGQGLQAAHDRQIVHRDLKPENILFNARGEALLADFGISTFLTSSSVKQTSVAGTPAYMAPEQFRGEVSKESDQYALACIAYELLTGLKPFNAPDIVSMGFLHTSEEPIPPREHNFYIPVHVEQAILKALSKRRADRFPTVEAFVTALLHEARRTRSNTRPLTPVEQEADEKTLADLPPTLAVPPVSVPAANTPPTVHAVHSGPASVDQQHISAAPVPPLFLPGPPEVEPQLSTPSLPAQGKHAPAGHVVASPPPPPPYAYGPQNVVAPPPPPRSQSPGYVRPPASPANGGQSYVPPSNGGQAQVFAPPLYRNTPAYPEIGYSVPTSARPPARLPANLRLLAAACYLVPILSWIVFFRVGFKNRFARFHFVQAVLGWLAWLLYLRFLQNLLEQHLTELYKLLSLGMFVFLLMLVLCVVRSLQGRIYRLWLIGPLAERLAGRPRGPGAPR